MRKTYEVICWPEVQGLFDWPGFREHSYLINDDKGMEDFGSSAYFVESEWLIYEPFSPAVIFPWSISEI